MTPRHHFHGRHQQLIVVISQIGLFENRSKFELVRSHLIVAGFYRDSQLLTFVFQILHKSNHPSRYRTEIMIIQLLIFSTFMSHHRPAGKYQIRTGRPQAFVYQKIFLLPSQIREHFFHLRVEIPANIHSRTVYCLECPQKRGLEIQGLPRISNKDSRYTKGRIDNKGRRTRIPGTISPGFKCIAKTTARKTGSIRFLLYQQLSCELFQHSSFVIGLDKSIVFLRSSSRQGLKPMRIVSSSHILSPLFHSGSHTIGCFPIQRAPVLHRIHQRFETSFRQIFPHFVPIKNIFSEILCRTFGRCFYFYGFSSDRLFNHFKSKCCHNIYCLGGSLSLYTSSANGILHPSHSRQDHFAG